MELTRYRQIALYVLIFGVHHFDSDELVSYSAFIISIRTNSLAAGRWRC
jgi:hypothetical protein